MISIIRRGVPTLLTLSRTNIKPSKQFFRLSHQLVIDSSTDTVVSSLCESLRSGLSWDRLSETFGSTTLNDRIVESVLLELKEPLEAKKALAFFHWAARTKMITHGLKTYCLAVHIAARGRLFRVARGLLESILKRNEETEINSSTRLVIVDMLLNTYSDTNSCPLVFEFLVQTYSELRMFESAFDACCYLDKHGFSLSLRTFNTLLHAVKKSADGTGFVWKVYEHMIHMRIFPNEATERILIDALSKAGELQIYIDLIDRIHGKRCSPLIIVNTSLVYRALKEGRVEEGITSLKMMLRKNIILDTISYSLTVYARLKSSGIDSAKEFYGEMLKRGHNPNSFLYTVFIGAYCEKGMVEDALGLFKEMKSIDLKPYDGTFNYLMPECAKIGDFANSIRLFGEMTKKRMLPSSPAFYKVVEMLCLAGKMKQADKMLTVLTDKKFVPDIVPYTHLIVGYGRERNIDEVLKLYCEVEFKSLSPGLPIFTSLIRTLCDCGKIEKADKYLSIMKSRSLDPTVCIYESLISGLLDHGNKGRAQQLYSEACQKGLKISQPLSSRFHSEALESSIDGACLQRTA